MVISPIVKKIDFIFENKFNLDLVFINQNIGINFYALKRVFP